MYICVNNNSLSLSLTPCMLSAAKHRTSPKRPEAFGRRAGRPAGVHVGGAVGCHGLTEGGAVRQTHQEEHTTEAWAIFWQIIGLHMFTFFGGMILARLQTEF